MSCGWLVTHRDCRPVRPARPRTCRPSVSTCVHVRGEFVLISRADWHVYTGDMAKKAFAILVTAIAVAIPISAAAQARRDVSALRVGAAKVDITPSQGELPKNSLGVLDRLYARAIVLESGTSTRGAHHDRRRRRADAPLGSGDQAGRIRAEDSGGQRPADGDAHPQRRRTAWARLRAEDRGVGPHGQAAADAGAAGLRHRRLVHQRQPPDRRSEDGPLVGRPQLRRAVRQDGRRPQVRDGGGRADCRLLQLRGARGPRGPARSGERRHSRRRLALRRGVVRRPDRGGLVERGGRRPEPDLLPADL